MGRNIAKTNPKPILIPRCKTGINNLDDALSGGFPTRSMILLGGGPGSGKTILGMTFLANGAEMFGERGMYVSFLESKGTMYAEMKQIGIDLQKLENQKKFFYEEIMSVTSKAMGDVLGQIIATITKNKIKRVVFDSITAVAQAFDQEYEARQVLHTVVSNIVRNLGCTTLVISERLSQSPSDSHFEEFVADGVVGLKAGPPRELEIRKMRGTQLSQRVFICTINSGFNVLKTELTVPSVPKICKPIPNPVGKISSGSEDFDRVLKGGFLKGAYVVCEADNAVTTAETRLFTVAATLNAVASGHGTLVVHSPGGAPIELYKQIHNFLPPENLKLLRAVQLVSTDEDGSGMESIAPIFVSLKGGKENFETDRRIISKTISELKQHTNDEPILRIVYYAALETEQRQLHNAIVLSMTSSQISGDIVIGVARPSLSILPELLGMVDWYFKLSKSHGTLLLQGIKPETPIYAVGCDTSKGYPVATLIEVT